MKSNEMKYLEKEQNNLNKNLRKFNSYFFNQSFFLN